ncbi:MAG: hypothetical protein JSW25_05210 [Thermoplasmata archaeon]|nr:MAG: hypothetical protein JSW25_05210 [Thermoplasmata archaeon]
MAKPDKDKGYAVERDRKIKKLTKMIKGKERELDVIEAKSDKAKAQVARGDMSKGDYQRLNIELARDRKAVRGAITRLEKSRLNRERKIKENQLKKEEKAKEREERREKRAEEKARKAEERAAKKAGSDGDEDEE